MLFVDEDAARPSIPALMPEPPEERRNAFEAMHGVAALFGVGPELATARKAS